MSASYHLGLWSEISRALNEHRSRQPDSNDAKYAAWKKTLEDLTARQRAWAAEWLPNGNGVETTRDLAGWIRDKIDLSQQSPEGHQYSGLPSQTETDLVKWAIVLAGKFDVIDRPPIPTDLLNKTKCIAILDQLLGAIQKKLAADAEHFNRRMERARSSVREGKYVNFDSHRRDSETRQAIWRKLLQDGPVFDGLALKAAADGLRNLRGPSLDEKAMTIMCAAAKAGAFAGGAWEIWRTQVASHPNFLNALQLLPDNCGISYNDRAWYAGALTDAKRQTFLRLADLIESFIIPATDATQVTQSSSGVSKKSRSFGGRPRVSEAAAKIRRECLSEWSRCPDKAQIFCNRWNASHPSLQIRPATIKKFQTWLASQGGQKTSKKKSENPQSSAD